MRFCHELPVRYADTDAQGHVFFANYLTYFDEALTYYLVAIGFPYSRIEELGAMFVYADARCSYRGSARFGDVVAIEASMARIGTTSMTASLQATVDGRPVADGELVCVWLDATTRTKTPVPAPFREAVDAYEA